MVENVKPAMPKTDNAKRFMLKIKEYSQSDIADVKPQFPRVPLTSHQPAEDSTLGHCAPKSWYRTGTIFPWTPSYSAPPRYVPSPRPIHSYLS